MAYCTQSDLELAAGGADKLAGLADYDADGSSDSTVVARAISTAERLIDSYVQRRETVPLAVVPDHVRNMCAEEAVYRLKRYKRQLTSDDTTAHEEFLEYLRDVAAGRASLGVDPHPAKSSAVAGEADTRDVAVDDIGIDRDSLGGAW